MHGPRIPQMLCRSSRLAAYDGSPELRLFDLSHGDCTIVCLTEGCIS
jgi:hypothetical protein